MRSSFVLPLLLWSALRSRRQALASDGCSAAWARRHQGAFWTLTLWRDAAAMRAFMLAGPHRKVMPRISDWCDEASLAHWEYADLAPPTWAEAEQHLRNHGRTTPLRHPSPAQAAGTPLP